MAELAGVRMAVETNRWTGSPADLDDAAVPLRVTIENGSGRPLRIRYDGFKLLGPQTFKSTAMAP